MASKFVKAFENFQKEVVEKTDTVKKNATISLMKRANTSVREGGNLPIDTGFLQNSVTGGGQVGLATGKQAFEGGIKAVPKGDDVYAGWDAEYWKYQEFGTDGIAPKAFLRKETAQWKQIVRREVNDL